MEEIDFSDACELARQYALEEAERFAHHRPGMFYEEGLYPPYITRIGLTILERLIDSGGSIFLRNPDLGRYLHQLYSDTLEKEVRRLAHEAAQEAVSRRAVALVEYDGPDFKLILVVTDVPDGVTVTLGQIGTDYYDGGNAGGGTRAAVVEVTHNTDRALISQTLDAMGDGGSPLFPAVPYDAL